MEKSITELMGYESYFGEESQFNPVNDIISSRERRVGSDQGIHQTLIAKKRNSANGFYYFYDGTFLGNFGTSDEVVVCKERAFYAKSKTNPTPFYEFRVPVRMKITNGELNMRAVLGVMQIHEGSYKEYYKWNLGDTFTEAKAKLGHPGLSPQGKQAAGAYQIQKDSWNDKDTGLKFRNKYDIKDFLPKSQDKFTIATMKDKATVRSYNDIIVGEFKKAYAKMAGEWRFIEGPKSQSGIKIETLLVETKKQIVREIKGDSPVDTPVGELLTGFE